MFSSPRFGHSDNPWFRIGGLAVNTTVFVVGLGIASMVVWGIEGRYGPIFQHLVLVSESFPNLGSVLEGDIWRLITWPIPNEPDLWTILLFVVFYLLGSQMEMLLGRSRFAWFLVALVVIPSVLVTGLEAATGITGGASGLRLMEVGVLVAFAAQYAQARFWPGIPGWVIAVVIVGIDALRAIGDRDNYRLVLLGCTVAVALLGIRAMGYANSQTWIPKLSLSTSRGSERAGDSRGRSRSRRGRSHLRSVPQSDESADSDIDALLDQVASRGISSLTRSQRKKLEAHARRLRRRH